MKLIAKYRDPNWKFWLLSLGIPHEHSIEKAPQRIDIYKKIAFSYEWGKSLDLPNGSTGRQRFYSNQKTSHPTERAARLPVRRWQNLAYVFTECWLKVKGQKGNPLTHLFLWHLPNPDKGLFGFRIDTDFATDEELMALYKLCRKYDIRATWFVEVKSRKERLDIFREMENQEIALHCFNHRLSRSKAQQSRDIMEALRYMKLADLHPKGYAAPYGEWRPWLPELLRDYGFEYSSEFGLAWDALPFFPPGEKLETLPPQIPIHPISVNRLKHAHHTPSQMTAYYLDVLYRNSRSYTPTFLYHHPAQGHLNVWEAIFRNVREKNIPVMSMGDYAAWWKRRTLLNWSAEWVDNDLKIISHEPTDNIWACFHYFKKGRTELRSFNSDTTPIPIRVRFGGKRMLSFSHDINAKSIEPGYSWRMFRHDLLWHYRRLKQ